MLFAQEISGETGVVLLRVVPNFYGGLGFLCLLVLLVFPRNVPGIPAEGEVPFPDRWGVLFVQVSCRKVFLFW